MLHLIQAHPCWPTCPTTPKPRCSRLRRAFMYPPASGSSDSVIPPTRCTSWSPGGLKSWVGKSPAAVAAPSCACWVPGRPWAKSPSSPGPPVRPRRARAGTPFSLRAAFGLDPIEVLTLPFFCVSADLVRAETVVHQQGSLWKALLASVSIPGLLPPVAVGDQLLVDGGVLNNLPVDVMADTGEGPVVAVDVMRPFTGRRAAPAATRSLRRAAEAADVHPVARCDRDPSGQVTATLSPAALIWHNTNIGAPHPRSLIAYDQ